jgi:pimeloyl-ACP methyl ester carboxylesterase
LSGASEKRHGEVITSRRGFFWVGVERVAGGHGTVPRGPMYVEWEEPADARHPVPLVLVHGGGGQGLDWLGRPGGLPGWTTYLVQEGYTVYVVDRPGHGRASFHPDVLGPMGEPPTYERAMARMTSAANGPMDHPTASLHTQWPGTGEIGDPALDSFMASSGPMLADWGAAHALEQARGAELLDRIGPAVLITTSAGGPMGWLTADARPELVRAIVALEPLGPPFAEDPALGRSLEWGLTQAPLTYEPPITDPSKLRRVTHDPPYPGRTPLILQEEPARSLPNLRGIPIAIVSGEASWFAHQDGQTVEFLKQAGCDAEHLRLAEHGVHGNGHLMMLEKNSREVLQVILDWLEAKVGRG